MAERTFVYELVRLDVGMPCVAVIPEFTVPNGIDGTTDPGVCDKGGGCVCCKFLVGILEIGGLGKPAVSFKMCSAKAGSVPGGG
jgi:hypothetical protein